MSDSRSDSDLQRLNLLGKAVVLGGAAVRGLANLIDLSIERAADIVVEAEQAFRKELDENIEDAKILEEYDPRQHSSADR